VLSTHPLSLDVGACLCYLADAVLPTDCKSPSAWMFFIVRKNMDPSA
jgi:hypothetical protein